MWMWLLCSVLVGLAACAPSTDESYFEHRDPESQRVILREGQELADVQPTAQQQARQQAPQAPEAATVRSVQDSDVQDSGIQADVVMQAQMQAQPQAASTAPSASAGFSLQQVENQERALLERELQHTNAVLAQLSVELQTMRTHSSDLIAERSRMQEALLTLQLQSAELRGRLEASQEATTIINVPAPVVMQSSAQPNYIVQQQAPQASTQPSSPEAIIGIVQNVGTAQSVTPAQTTPVQTTSVQTAPVQSAPTSSSSSGVSITTTPVTTPAASPATVNSQADSDSRNGVTIRSQPLPPEALNPASNPPSSSPQVDLTVSMQRDSPIPLSQAESSAFQAARNTLEPRLQPLGHSLSSGYEVYPDGEQVIFVYALETNQEGFSATVGQVQQALSGLPTFEARHSLAVVVRDPEQARARLIYRRGGDDVAFTESRDIVEGYASIVRSSPQ